MTRHRVGCSDYTLGSVGRGRLCRQSGLYIAQERFRFFSRPGHIEREARAFVEILDGGITSSGSPCSSRQINPIANNACYEYHTSHY